MNSIKNAFRYNKKRKHYSYIYKITNDYCFNILLTTQQFSIQKKHGKEKLVKNIKLYKHPNGKSNKFAFLYNHSPYVDKVTSFDAKTLLWKWNVNDKRKVKRIIKYKKYKSYFESQ